MEPESNFEVQNLKTKIFNLNVKIHNLWFFCYVFNLFSAVCIVLNAGQGLRDIDAQADDDDDDEDTGEGDEDDEVKFLPDCTTVNRGGVVYWLLKI